MDGVYNLMTTQDGEPFRLTQFYEYFEELLKISMLMIFPAPASSAVATLNKPIAPAP
jgi:hypothetical protein